MQDTLLHESRHGTYAIYRNRIASTMPYAVFLHGGPGFHIQAERRLLGPLLHEDLNVLWLDMLGCHAAPARSPQAVTIDNTLEDLVDIITTHTPPGVHLIGHCISSQIVHALVRRVPQYIHRVVFIGPNEATADTFKTIVQLWLDGGHLDAKALEPEETDRWLRAFEEPLGPAQVELFLRIALQGERILEPYWVNQDAMREYLELIAVYPHNLEHFIPLQTQMLALPAPDYRALYRGREVLFLQGQGDRVTRWEPNGKVIADALDDNQVSVERIPQAGHWPHLEAREACARVLVEFLGR